MDPTRVAFIGCGGIAVWTLPDFASLGETASTLEAMDRTLDAAEHENITR